MPAWQRSAQPSTQEAKIPSPELAPLPVWRHSSRTQKILAPHEINVEQTADELLEEAKNLEGVLQVRLLDIDERMTLKEFQKSFAMWIGQLDANLIINTPLGQVEFIRHHNVCLWVVFQHSLHPTVRQSLHTIARAIERQGDLFSEKEVETTAPPSVINFSLPVESPPLPEISETKTIVFQPQPAETEPPSPSSAHPRTSPKAKSGKTSRSKRKRNESR